MPVSSNHVYLYAAVPPDLEKALAAADVSGIPTNHVIGSYSKAWTLIESGNSLVIAVGGAALDCLHYNACDWPNPKGMAGGHTPFSPFAAGHGVDTIMANKFVNAAGPTAMDSLKLAVMLSYYAVHGAFPHQLNGLPRQLAPQARCGKGWSSDIVYHPPVRHPTSAAPSSTAPQVGLYADYTTLAQVEQAISLGWQGIADTGGLGIAQAPYTQVLSYSPDASIAEALSLASSKTWWLSFWTVSWPAQGDTFHGAGNTAGQYVGQQLQGLASEALPTYVILDPEGFNTPATTTKEWTEFATGWKTGLQSVLPTLNPAIYCNQNQYETYKLSTLSIPVFVAVSPITGNKPAVSGGNIEGFAAYYATCPASTLLAEVKSWGGRYNTVQFRDSGVDCAP